MMKHPDTQKAAQVTYPMRFLATLPVKIYAAIANPLQSLAFYAIRCTNIFNICHVYIFKLRKKTEPS
jgi:hypothetical protein